MVGKAKLELLHAHVLRAELEHDVEQAANVRQ